MNESFLNKVVAVHHQCQDCPHAKEVDQFFQDLLGLLFPSFASHSIKDVDKLKEGFEHLKGRLNVLLNDQDHLKKNEVVESVFSYVPTLYEFLLKDVDAIYEGDPAANSKEEVVRSYPGFYAIASYRFAHKLLALGVHILPRV
ncbi:MAG: serine acetyltransferase, partial [Bacteroidota bacterium]